MNAAEPARPDLSTDDVVALGRLQARYADIVTRLAWEELGAIFRPGIEVVVDTVTGPERRFTGPEEFGTFVAGAISRFDHFQFVILNAVVGPVIGPLSGAGNDQAEGRMFMCEIRRSGQDTPEPGEWTTAYGCYQDRYVRVDGRWWFAARRYRSMGRTGTGGGVFGVPPNTAPLG